MLKAELRELHSPDLADMARNRPDNPRNFGLLVQALIGPHGQEGEESFDFLVCTPAYLAEEMRESGYCFGRQYLFVLEYNYTVIENAIAELCDRASGEEWKDLADYLSRYGRWEFDEYQEE